ncbi:hypothetical protein JB92DRAFT_2833192 [Gautieria morchelliformis]|nr:hypothetical protein JB92DRAFT_2833192 [Gautieria morchelliformis]
MRWKHERMTWDDETVRQCRARMMKEDETPEPLSPHPYRVAHTRPLRSSEAIGSVIPSLSRHGKSSLTVNTEFGSSSKQDAHNYVPPCLAYVYAGTAILQTIASPRQIPHSPTPSTGSHADRRPAHLTYGPAHGLDLALRANTDGDMDLDTASIKTATGLSLPIVSTRSRTPLSPTPPAPQGSSPHASESRAHVSTSGMGSSLNENAHVREMRAQTLNRPQDPAQRHTHTEWKTAWSENPSLSLLRQPLHHQGASWVRLRHFDWALPTTVSSPSLKRLRSAPVLPSEAGAGEEAGDHAHTCSVLGTPAESGIDDGGSLLATPMVWAIRARTGWGWRRIFQSGGNGFFHWVIRPSKNVWLGSGFRVNAGLD